MTTSRLDRQYGVFTPEILDHLEKLAQGGQPEVRVMQKRLLQVCEEIRWCWSVKFELEQSLIKEQGSLLAMGRENYLQLKIIDELKAQSEGYRKEVGRLRGALVDKDNELMSLQKRFKAFSGRLKELVSVED